jgi:transcriptional regulator with XRE-family HTH domain
MFGDNIKNIRKDKNISLNKLAKLAGISTGYLSDIENNNATNPTMDKLEGIAKALGVTINDFLTTEEKLNLSLKTINEMVKNGLKDSAFINKNTINYNSNHDILDPFENVQFTKDEKEEIMNYMKYILSKRR